MNKSNIKQKQKKNKKRKGKERVPPSGLTERKIHNLYKHYRVEGYEG